MPSGTYTFSLDNVMPSNSNITLWRDTSTGILSFSGPSKTFTASTTFNLFRIVIHYNEGATFDNFVIKPMLVKGTSTAEYEQYGQQICSNKLDEQTKTSKNIWETIKSFPSTFSKFFTDLADKIGKFFDNLLTGILNGIKSLFVPDDFSFIDDFKTTLENKLGFIASIPIQLLDYLLSLKNKALNPMNKITFPKISIFGYYFWDNMEIDITKGLGWISSFKYLTDLGCVIIVVNTLRKWYVNFTGGDEK